MKPSTRSSSSKRMPSPGAVAADKVPRIDARPLEADEDAADAPGVEPSSQQRGASPAHDPGADQVAAEPTSAPADSPTNPAAATGNRILRSYSPKDPPSGVEMTLPDSVTDTQVDVLRGMAEFESGCFLYGQTGSGKTLLLSLAGRCRNFFLEPDRGSGERSGLRIVLLLSTSNLAQQHRNSFRLAGFDANNIFPKENKPPRLQDLPDFIETSYKQCKAMQIAGTAVGMDIAIVMSIGSFQRSYVAKTGYVQPWVMLIRKKAAALSILVDEVHSQLLEKQRTPTSALKTMARVALLMRERSKPLALYVFGASASLDETTTIGTLLRDGATIESNAQKGGRSVDTKILARAIALVRLDDVAAQCTENGEDDIFSAVCDESSSMYSDKVPLYSVSEAQYAAIKDELAFSNKATLRKVPLDGARFDCFESHMNSMVFLNSIIGMSHMRTHSRNALPSSQMCTQYLRKEITYKATKHILDIIMGHNSELAFSNCMPYCIKGAAEPVKRACIVGISASSVVSTKLLFDTLSEFTDSTESSLKIDDVVDIGLCKVPDKDHKFNLLRGKLNGSNAQVLKRGIIVVVMNPEMLQGHDGIHLLFSKLFMVGFDEAYRLEQAQGRFSRSTLDAEIRLHPDVVPEVVNFTFEEVRDLEKQQAILTQRFGELLAAKAVDDFGADVFVSHGHDFLNLKKLHAKSKGLASAEIFRNVTALKRYIAWNAEQTSGFDKHTATGEKDDQDEVSDSDGEVE